jgi:hypothetical protein
MASLTLSTFFRVRAVATGPDGFFFIAVPLVRKGVTRFEMALRLGMSVAPDIESEMKEPLSFNN